jgi:hypothetical protein
LELLRDWYRIARPAVWLFPGRDPLLQFAFLLELFTLARSDSTTDYRYDLGIRVSVRGHFGSWRET